MLRVPPEGECEILRAQDIVVTDGVIEAVQPTGATGPSGAADVIDGRGLLAVPGLVNAHTHSPMVLMRGAAEDVTVEGWFNDRVRPMESNLIPEDVRAGARLACAEMIRSGVTTFADHYFFPEQIAGAVAETGLRADIAPTYFSSRARQPWRKRRGARMPGTAVPTAGSPSRSGRTPRTRSTTATCGPSPGTPGGSACACTSTPPSTWSRPGPAWSGAASPRSACCTRRGSSTQAP
ncbi:hypothetical protein QF034_000642 [Streptomyces africanus]|uniref:Amidohydrolase-related domain-containing protein n=1 Tax=Streptomyces africanus TaxID=231024 RepID=A0ABU0QG97_9ACTN|nr:hypothetical protein [Streptomyces africanus]